MRDIIEVVALALGFMSWTMVGVSLQDKQWKKNSGDGGVVITNEIFENLWMACATDSMGTFDCYEFQSMLALPGYIQVCRACMIASAILGAIGVVLTLFGMQCSKVADHNHVLKSRLVALGGFCFLMQGLCTVVAAAWYTCSIVYEFFDRFYDGTKDLPLEPLTRTYQKINRSLSESTCSNYKVNVYV
ncbi:claudin-15-like [Engraulis encrasicolus]|uniref:claudin-15-like n=1 Tax=Engraulis encrasicolus TaxID=184585 RepID=UPI002FD2A653